MRFGMDLASLDDQRAFGLEHALGVTWVGAWTLEHGWGEVDQQLARARELDVTPVIQLYYWGDDISPASLEDGCWSELHQAEKTQAGWRQLCTELTEHLTTQVDGREAVVVLESEFNKGGVTTYAPLGDMLSERARQLGDGYPEARVALGLGNWARGTWSTWEHAAQACDLVSLQALRGATRDDPATYQSMADEVLAGARQARDVFSRPVLLSDLALSSYPEPDYLEHQAQALQALFDRMDALVEAGLEGVVYRCLFDDPSFDTDNYYGQAERHWGLVRPDGRDPKPALEAWQAR